MYLKRKADQFLIDWKNDENHLPLIIKGARQVGKTETIRHFAENRYENVIEINFAEEPKYKILLLMAILRGVLSKTSHCLILRKFLLPERH